MIFVESVSGPTIERTIERRPVATQTVEISTHDPKDYKLIGNLMALRNVIERALNYGGLASTLYDPKAIELEYDTTTIERDGMYNVSMKVTWLDGTQTKVTKSLDDNFDLYNAFVWCLAKRVFGGTRTVKNVVNRGIGSEDLVHDIETHYWQDEAEARLPEPYKEAQNGNVT